MKRILVTGAAGFIGQHTVALLQKEGYEVIALDKDWKRLQKLDCIHMPGDIRNIFMLDSAFKDYNIKSVIHLAAQSSVAKSMRNWRCDLDNNIIGTLNLVECCQKYGVKRIVFAASGGTVYGNPSGYPVPEDAPLNPISPYGISKLAAEFYIRISGISHAILRYPNVYGPGQPSDGESGVAAIFIGNITKNKSCLIYGDGSSTRDYVYVGDIARANLLALESEYDGVFNIGSGKETSVKYIMDAISEEMGLNPTVEFRSVRDGEVQRICFDVSRAKKLLGWKPIISIKEGIKLTVESMARRGQEDKSPVSCAGGAGSNPVAAKQTEEVTHAI